jgi:alpha-tubulin suppressor-like RCC1 family protein
MIRTNRSRLPKSALILATFALSSACADSGGPTPGTGPSHLDATQVALGDFFSCALLSDGSVVCWGTNQFGILGADGPNGSSDVPTRILGLDDVAAISAGTDHACALLANGSVSCWGHAGDGQLGSIPSGSNFSATPLAVSGLPSGVGSIACGGDTSCVRISSGGSVYCWGGNIYNQLGLDTNDTQSTTPVKVGSLNANAIATGTTSCAIVSGGVQCWGNNGDGQAGQTPIGTSSATPAAVVGLGGVGAPQGISVGEYHACANVAGGSVYCWGWNMYEQLGDDAAAEGAHATAVRVQGLSSGVTLVTAAYGHTCALLTNGRVVCWGLQRRGAIGDGQASEDGVAEDPVQVMDLANVTELSTRFLHSCAVLSNGAVKCWGSGASGELGNGASTDSSVPVSVTGW